MRKYLFLSPDAIFILTFLILFLADLSIVCAVVQEPDSSRLKYLNWYNASPDSIDIQGAQVDMAYRDFLSGKKSHPVIVAVIDGGVDITHEDLQGHIWINEKELKDNGLDDDGNGFTDDIHGWNFLGNDKGENIRFENFEYTRLAARYEEILKRRVAGSLEIEERKKLSMYRKAKKEFDKKLKHYTGEKEKIDVAYKGYVVASNVIKSYLNKDTFSKDELLRVNSTEDLVKKSKEYLLFLNEINYSIKDLEEIKENNYNHLFYHLNPDFNPRIKIGDNPDKSEYGQYGNNNVTGDHAEHGTFVSGIIAGVRNNGIGINGIADNVRIMSLRVVPDGDERDKDIANAIRYAVENGAQVINCSFGKYYSPQKELVDDALQMAYNKGIVIVHAAGNEAINTNKNIHHPNCRLLNGKDLSENWITVGASSMKAGKDLPGTFSNYGAKSVDIFAPGVNIYSLHPGNTYDLGDGTSYASPVVAGVAALLKSYFPSLRASEIKNILLEAASRFPDLRVNLPDKNGKKEKSVYFTKLSSSGGIINAYEAVKKASQIIPNLPD